MLSGALFLLALFVQADSKPLPDLQTFLAKFRQALHTDDVLLSNYTYSETQTTLRYDSNHKVKKTERNVYQVFPGSCERPEYRRQIVKNGMPVPQKELEKKDREYEKEQRPTAGKAKDCQNKLKDEMKILDDLFGLYDIQIVGRETVADHPTILVTFKPRPNYKTKTREGGIMKHVVGRAWVGEDDYQLARLDAEVVDNISIGFGMLAKLQKGAHVFEERKKVNDEVWLPARVEVSLDARILLLKGVNVKQIVEYSDHRKFSVDTILKFPDQ